VFVVKGDSVIKKGDVLKQSSNENKGEVTAILKDVPDYRDKKTFFQRIVRRQEKPC
jgi:hypothetical protein